MVTTDSFMSQEVTLSNSAFVLDGFQFSQHTAVLHTLKQMMKITHVPIPTVTFQAKPR
jgi:hypothetical protein